MARRVRDNPSKFPSLIEGGNIDLKSLPSVSNPDGTHSSVRSMSVSFKNGEHVLIPTIHPLGSVMTPDESIIQYRRTGRHLGKYGTAEAATQASKSYSRQKR